MRAESGTSSHAPSTGPLKVTIKGNWGNPHSRPLSSGAGASLARGPDQQPKKRRKKHRDNDIPLPKLKIKSNGGVGGGWDHQLAQDAAAAAMAQQPFSRAATHFSGYESGGNGGGSNKAGKPSKSRQTATAAAGAKSRPQRKAKKNALDLPKAPPAKVSAAAAHTKVSLLSPFGPDLTCLLGPHITSYLSTTAYLLNYFLNATGSGFKD